MSGGRASEGPAPSAVCTPVGVACDFLQDPTVPQIQGFTPDGRGRFHHHFAIEAPSSLNHVQGLAQDQPATVTYTSDLRMKGVNFIGSRNLVGDFHTSILQGTWVSDWKHATDAYGRDKAASFAFSARGVAPMHTDAVTRLVDEMTTCSMAPVLVAGLMYVYAKQETRFAAPTSGVDARGWQYRPSFNIAIDLRTRVEAAHAAAAGGDRVQYLNIENFTDVEVATLVMLFKGIQPLQPAQAAAAEGGGEVNDPLQPTDNAAREDDGDADANARAPDIAGDAADQPAAPAAIAHGDGALEHLYGLQAVLGAPDGDRYPALGAGQAGTYPVRAARASVACACNVLHLVTERIGGEHGIYRTPAAGPDARAVRMAAINAAQPLTDPDALLALIMRWAADMSAMDQLVTAVGICSRNFWFQSHGLYNHWARRAYMDVNIGPLNTTRAIMPMVFVEQRALDIGQNVYQVFDAGAHYLYLASVYAALQESCCLSLMLCQVATSHGQSSARSRQILDQSVAALIGAAVNETSSKRLASPWRRTGDVGYPIKNHLARAAHLKVGPLTPYVDPVALDVFGPFYSYARKSMQSAIRLEGSGNRITLDGSPRDNGLYQYWYLGLSAEERRAIRVRPSFTMRGGHVVHTFAEGAGSAQVANAGGQQQHIAARWNRLFSPRLQTLPAEQNLPARGPAGQPVKYALLPNRHAQAGLHAQAALGRLAALVRHIPSGYADRFRAVGMVADHQTALPECNDWEEDIPGDAVDIDDGFSVEPLPPHRTYLGATPAGFGAQQPGPLPPGAHDPAGAEQRGRPAGGAPDADGAPPHGGAPGGAPGQGVPPVPPHRPQPQDHREVAEQQRAQEPAQLAAQIAELDALPAQEPAPALPRQQPAPAPGAQPAVANNPAADPAAGGAAVERPARPNRVLGQR